MLGDDLALGIQNLLDVHEDTVLFHRHLTVLLQQKVECLGESALTGWAKKISLNRVDVGMAAPDDAKRLEQVTINMQRRRERFSQFRDGRRRNIGDARSVAFEPRVSQNISHLRNNRLVL